MARDLILSEPESLGFIEPELLYAVRTATEGLARPDEEFRVDLSFDVPDSIRAPLEAIMLQAGIRVGEYTNITVDTSTATPLTTQRVGGWHADRAKDCITVCDTLPTKFLTGSIENTEENKLVYLSLVKAIRRKLGVSDDAQVQISDPIWRDESGLKSSSAEPFELKLFDSRVVHRPVINTSKEATPRTWIRFHRF